MSDTLLQSSLSALQSWKKTSSSTLGGAGVFGFGDPDPKAKGAHYGRSLKHLVGTDLTSDQAAAASPSFASLAASAAAVSPPTPAAQPGSQAAMDENGDEGTVPASPTVAGKLAPGLLSVLMGLQPASAGSNGGTAPVSTAARALPDTAATLPATAEAAPSANPATGTTAGSFFAAVEAELQQAVGAIQAASDPFAMAAAPSQTKAREPGLTPTPAVTGSPAASPPFSTDAFGTAPVTATEPDAASASGTGVASNSALLAMQKALAAYFTGAGTMANAGLSSALTI